MPTKTYIPRCSSSISHTGRDWSQRAAGVAHQSDQSARWAPEPRSRRQFYTDCAIVLGMCLGAWLIIAAAGWAFAKAFGA